MGLTVDFEDLLFVEALSSLGCADSSRGGGAERGSCSLHLQRHTEIYRQQREKGTFQTNFLVIPN